MAVKHTLLKDPLEEVEKLKAELMMLTEAVGEALSALPAPQVVQVTKDPVQGPTGPQGTSGRDGEGLNWRGTWSEKETYNRNDVVNYLGSSYIATKTTTKDYPNRINNGWDLLAASGASGARGPAGQDGLAGGTLDGIKFICDKSDFPDPVGGVITLEAGKTYWVTCDVDLTGDRLETGGVVTLLGTSSETSSLTSTGLTAGVPLLTSRYTIPVRFITFKDVDTGIYIDDNGGANAPLAVDWLGVNFLNVPNIGEVGTVDNFIYDTGAFLSSQNMKFTGSVGTVGLNNSLFSGTGSAGSLIEITSTATITRRFRTIYSSVVAFGSTVGYTIDASATIPVEGFILDTINFAGGGTYVSGLTSSDNKSRWSGCRGVPNSASISSYYMNGNATATAVASTSVAYKAAGTTTSSSITQKFTNTNNRATYIGALEGNFRVTGVLSFDAGTNDQIGLYIAKNGTVLPESEVYVTANSGGRAESAVVQVLTTMQQNDYIEIFVENSSSVADITVSELNVAVEEVG
jgi:hypothetical protein